jgi:hypothetical protein
MNRPLDPSDIEVAGAEWLARNDEALQLGMAWLGERLESLDGVWAAPGSGPDAPSTRRDLQADRLLRTAWAQPNGAQPGLRAQYDAAREAMIDAGAPCALDLLAAIFDLTPFDLDVLLLALAPQVEARFAALYGYAHDRPALAHATRHLAEGLLCSAPQARRLARARLAPQAPLRARLLIWVEGPGALEPITLDERIAGFIQGIEGEDARLAGLLHPISPAPTPGRLQEVAWDLAQRMAAEGAAAAQLIGPRRCGRRAAAQAAAAHLGLRAAEVETRALPATTVERRSRLQLLAREAALSRLCLVFDTAPDLQGPDDPAGPQALSAGREAVALGEAVTLVLAEDPTSGLENLPIVRLSALTRADRLWAWSATLAGRDFDPELLEAVVDHFPFGLAQIGAVAASLGDAAGADRQTLWAACRERAPGRLEGLARRIEAQRGWNDLVVPPEILRDLQAVASQVAQRGTVYGRWGYDALLPRGRGISALFAGPSGVGKTLAAEVIAFELGLDLYCVDLATVVSKYIGETEKNLKRIFDAAEEAGAVLFIDEADALFGKRTEVKDSHDRYANIEISYLLQRIEQYSGLAILATNMRSHIDFGFLRRLRYLIDFPFPTFANRQTLWRKAFPPGAPCRNLDFDRLAELEIAGGNIIVIATNAAFLAAGEAAAISMRHVVQAAHAEFRKLDQAFDLQLGGETP